ncbi:hypothetical protein [Chitinimonas sp.]|uniref:hypothetical protein n=1 Tax=Chitinimonas sp. TaxID=1934313 RepID=UPI002F95CBB7
MTMILLTLLVAPLLAVLGIAGGILHLHHSMGPHHLRGRYTWAEELAAREAEWMKD